MVASRPDTSFDQRLLFFCDRLELLDRLDDLFEVSLNPFVPVREDHKRLDSPMRKSVSRSSRPPAFEVIGPPSNRPTI